MCSESVNKLRCYFEHSNVSSPAFNKIGLAMTMLAMARGSEERRDKAEDEAEGETEANGEVDVVGVEEPAPVDLTRRLGLTRPPDRPAIAFSVENILDPTKFTGRSEVPLRYDEQYWRPHYDRDDSDSGKLVLFLKII